MTRKNGAICLLMAGVLAVLTGCADKPVSDDTIRSKTALIMDVPESDVVISHRRYDGQFATYYDATVHGRVYDCIITGGSVTQFGLTDPPGCQPKGSTPFWEKHSPSTTEH